MKKNYNRMSSKNNKCLMSKAFKLISFLSVSLEITLKTTFFPNFENNPMKKKLLSVINFTNLLDEAFAHVD
jgi:hypothetical protein